LTLPPLRDRKADIPLLAAEAVASYGHAAGYGAPPTIHPELMLALQAAPWPNNLRQLDATIHRLIVEADGASELTPFHCLDELSYLAMYAEHGEPLTRERVDAALERAGSVSGAARVLGVHRTTLHRYKRGIEVGRACEIEVRSGNERSV
ncbi:MAG: helix-turn-helix domain-containing protein, partial [bacterium]